MTIIALATDGKNCGVVCDLALSGSSRSIPMNWEDLPLQFIKSRKGKLPQRPDVGRVIDLDRKVAIFGKTIILWSGHWLTAKKILHSIDSIPENIPLCECVLSKIDKISLGKVSIIAARISTEGIEICCNDCEMRTYGNVKIYASGSGTYKFFDEFDSINTHQNLHNVFRQITSRAAHLATTEIADETHYHFGIGGFYEFALAEKTGWRFQPYSMGFFWGSEIGFSCQGMITTSYLDNHLLITSMSLNSVCYNLEEWTYLSVNGFDNIHFDSIDDTLGSRGAALDTLRNIPYQKFQDVAQEHSELSIALVGRAGSEKQTATFTYSCNVPSVVQARIALNDAGLFSDNSTLYFKKEFLREIESYYLRRPFVPPKHVADRYPSGSISWDDCSD